MARYDTYRLLSCRRPTDKPFEHTGTSFSRTGARASDYIINPDWVSETTRQSTSTPFGGRRYRPWSYEFQGARLWPYGTLEAREEQRAYRRLVSSAPPATTLEQRPQVNVQDRTSLNTPVRFVALPSQLAWRSTNIAGSPAKEYSPCRTEITVDRNPTRPHQKVVTGTDTYFVGHGDAPRNAAGYGYSSSYQSRMATCGGSSSEDHPYRDQFPVVNPQKVSPPYMNFVNPDWLRQYGCV